MSTKLTAGQKFLITEMVQLLAQTAYGNSKEHGFWDEFYDTARLLPDGLRQKFILDTKLSKIALMHSELGEATEGVRKPHADEHVEEFSSEEIEMADTVIRILDYAAAFNLRLGEAIMAKMAYNEGRPYKHGKGA